MENFDIEFNALPDRAFLPAIRKRDILMARPLSPKEKRSIQRGGPDIKVKTPLSHSGFYTRDSIISNYTYLDGTRIRLTAWKNSQSYRIMRDDNTNIVALMVPKNCTLSINGDVIKKAGKHNGTYLICFLTDTGEIDRSTVGYCSSAMFKKMFMMLPNDVITKYKYDGSHNKLMYTPTSTKRSLSVESERVASPTIAMDFSQIIGKAIKSIKPKISTPTGFGDEDLYESAPTPETPEIKIPNTEKILKSIQLQPEYKYKAIGKVLNQEGQIDSFVILDLVSRETSYISKSQLLELCKKKLVENIMIYTSSNEAGEVKISLRGNGIKISSLMEYPPM